MTANPDPYPVRTAFQLFLPEYMLSVKMDPHQLKTASNIACCKTGECGYVVEECSNEECGHTRIHAASCNNRHCPSCQYTSEQEWIAARQSELIKGVAYYHAIFTVPYQLNDLIYENQKLLYNLMFRCVSQTLLELCQDKQYLGAKPGIVAVLHTHGQKMNFHPHIHTMLSGGGLTREGQFIEAVHKGYLLPKAAMGKLFRGKFLDSLKQMHEENTLSFTGKCRRLRNSYEWKEFIDSLYKTTWIPHIKETFNGSGSAVKYLARYVYRSAISNNRIEEVNPDGVTFRYKDYRDDSKWKSMHMSGFDFIGSFMQHVLPEKFCKVRFYGYLANSVRTKNLILIHQLRNTVYSGNPVKDKSKREVFKILFHTEICVCPRCHSPTSCMRISAAEYRQRIRTLTG